MNYFKSFNINKNRINLARLSRKGSKW